MACKDNARMRWSRGRSRRGRWCSIAGPIAPRAALLQG